MIKHAAPARAVLSAFSANIGVLLEDTVIRKKKRLDYVLTRYYTMTMKKHAPTAKSLKAGVESLAQAINGLKNAEQIYAFLVDLCTPAELEAMADRWQVVEPLSKATPYRQIHDETGVSVTTIGRVARCLELGTGGYLLALKNNRKGASA